MKPLLLSAMLCTSLPFFSSCGNFNKIKIPADKIEEVESSMRFVKQMLEKSAFDTVEIVKTEIQRGIDYELQTNSRALSRDSISKEVHKNFKIDQIFPLSKKLYCYRDGSITLNDRLIGKDFGDFEKNILACREFENITVDDRKRFVKSVAVLLANNIWSCWKYDFDKDKTGYQFDYSKENLYINRWHARYLYLIEDVQNETILTDKYGDEFMDEYKLIDKKNGLRLYKLYKEKKIK
ncbi:hypothetical protein [Sphingobacterium ginsenosidimutans]|uniref:Lipoprotein n=1 Tax=Sphingobacterium ginsenosidimutans TaxID=687845 RepID=A0ABP7ZQR5_9SPHI